MARNFLDFIYLVSYWFYYILLVAGARFELTTFRLWAWRATGLLHPASPNFCFCIKAGKGFWAFPYTATHDHIAAALWRCCDALTQESQLLFSLSRRESRFYECFWRNFWLYDCRATSFCLDRLGEASVLVINAADMKGSWFEGLTIVAAPHLIYIITLLGKRSNANRALFEQIQHFVGLASFPQINA